LNANNREVAAVINGFELNSKIVWRHEKLVLFMRTGSIDIAFSLPKGKKGESTPNYVWTESLCAIKD
jgi:hypothetical protein